MNGSQTIKIFILDDDLLYSSMLEHFLSLNPDYSVTKFNDEEEFFKNLYLCPEIVTLDYALKKMNGAQALKKIKEYNSEIEVIMISGQEDVATAVGLLNEGAYDYIVKNDQMKDRLWKVIQHLIENKNLKKEVAGLKNELKKKYDYSKTLIGESPAIKRTLNLIEKAVNANITVSITGETGTGKEVVAKAIHFNSPRQKHPFVAINVAAIPKELLESELFGYEKGAFTGATGRRIGKFEEANKGTIFLDEIGEMDIYLQAKILRVIQEREITRIGSNTVVPIDVRIIVATHKNLANEVAKKTFREDLYFRLKGLTIELPPLRERGNDILILAKHFIANYCKENNQKLKTMTPAAQQKLLSYSFPGNVRELISIVELAVVMAENNIIDEEEICLELNSNISNILSKETTLKEYEFQIIDFFLKKYDNNVLLVAQKLDIGKSTIYRMLQNAEKNS